MGNEITVKLNCNIDEIDNILNKKGFKIINRFILDDIYFFPEKLDLKNKNCREILKESIILRKVVEFDPKREFIKLTKKIKDIDEQGNILKQKNIECDITNLEKGINFLNSIGYKRLMNIIEKDTEYEKDGFKILVKDVENSDNLIEAETQNSIELNTIDKIKERLTNLNLPIDTNDYFVKKAEIELCKIL